MSLQYREPKNKEELAKLYRLRHKVYSEDSFLHKMVTLNSNLDINQFDINSFHFAAFDKETPIAYIRITSSRPNNFTKWTEELLSENNIEIKYQNYTYPFENYYPDKIWIKNFIKNMSGKVTGEVGKLVIHEDYREGGKILFGLISQFHTYCFKENNYDLGFGSCSLILERYYQKFGFERVDQSIPFTFPGLPEAVMMQFKKTV
ncbi:MAG: hypothetical protein RI883_206 [Bacteroidota bacterium]|jgi:hypothetical protein